MLRMYGKQSIYMTKRISKRITIENHVSLKTKLLLVDSKKYQARKTQDRFF